MLNINLSNVSLLRSRWTALICHHKLFIPLKFKLLTLSTNTMKVHIYTHLEPLPRRQSSSWLVLKYNECILQYFNTGPSSTAAHAALDSVRLKVIYPYRCFKDISEEKHMSPLWSFWRWVCSVISPSNEIKWKTKKKKKMHSALIYY